MKDKFDYSLYECPYSHLEKDCGHELHGPEKYEDAYGVWCQCGFRGPVFYLDPDELRLELKADNQKIEADSGGEVVLCPHCGQDWIEYGGCPCVDPATT